MTGQQLVNLVAGDLPGESSLFESKQLVSSVLELPHTAPLLDEVVLTEDQQGRLEDGIRRRQQGEPLQYILGEWEFMGLPFLVEPGVLIPRQDTEVLCEEAVRLIKERGYKTALDLCCGTGCIGISVAKDTGIAVMLGDISRECLDISRKNAEKNGVAVRVKETDLFSAFNGRSFDLILCNPPYLNAEEMESLQTEVRYEPELALYGGRDGLDVYRRLAAEYESHLNPGGTMLLEIGYRQWEEIKELFPGAGLIKDLAGNPRVVEIMK